jgi:hypothetical protein
MIKWISSFATVLIVTSCTPRVNLITGTTIGLKATPGDGNTRPPQVVLGYKRAELSLVPTKGDGAKDISDAASTLAAIHFSTRWFGHTELDSFIATGPAARLIVASNSAFSPALESQTLAVAPEALLVRRKKIAAEIGALTEEHAKSALDLAGYPLKSGKSAKESLADYLGEARTEPLIERLESVVYRVR